MYVDITAVSMIIGTKILVPRLSLLHVVVEHFLAPLLFLMFMFSQAPGKLIENSKKLVWQVEVDITLDMCILPLFSVWWHF